MLFFSHGNKSNVINVILFYKTKKLVDIRCRLNDKDELLPGIKEYIRKIKFLTENPLGKNTSCMTNTLCLLCSQDLPWYATN
jgi:hypothetical protein